MTGWLTRLTRMVSRDVWVTKRADVMVCQDMLDLGSDFTTSEVLRLGAGGAPEASIRQCM